MINFQGAFQPKSSSNPVILFYDWPHKLPQALPQSSWHGSGLSPSFRSLEHLAPHRFVVTSQCASSRVRGDSGAGLSLEPTQMRSSPCWWQPERDRLPAPGSRLRALCSGTSLSRSRRECEIDVSESSSVFPEPVSRRLPGSKASASNSTSFYRHIVKLVTRQ